MQGVIAEAIETIERLKPESLIYCTEAVIPALEALAEKACFVSHARDIQELDALPRFELGLIFDFLEPRPFDVGTQFICRLRNVKCEKLWVAVANDGPWNLTAMISLGFKREHCHIADDIEICTYSYDIARYNKKREWNNPRFWANPENWGKYRW